MPKLTIKFSDQTGKILKELAAEKNTTQTEILRRALATYKYLVDETKDGDKRVSIISTSDKPIKEVILP